MDLTIRPRRLRTCESLRRMVRETRVSPDSLVYPLFLIEGEKIKEPIESLDGQYRYSPDRVCEAIADCRAAGVSRVLLFGIPARKDACGSAAWDENGVVQQGIRAIKAAWPDCYVITDVCLCEYTDHGHCGILQGQTVDNDKTLEVLAKTAVSHARAGADMVAPSDMMDGRVAAIRAALDEAQVSWAPGRRCCRSPAAARPTTRAIPLCRTASRQRRFWLPRRPPAAASRGGSVTSPYL